MTRRAPRLAVAAALAVAAMAWAGCGATLYDAQGVPKLACTTALPLACGFTCLAASAESDAQCGAQCLDCRNGGANALSGDAAATNFCNVNDPDVALHACDFSCDPAQGLQKNASTNTCACTNAAQVRCSGSTACVPQSDTLCGDACANCTNAAQFPAKAHAAWQCDAPNRRCDFFCAAGFKRNAANDGCICQDPAQVACGAGGACTAQTPAVCGANCVNCTNPAVFPVSAAVTATLCAGDGKGVSASLPCDYSCPTAAPNKFFNSTTKQWDCSAAPVCDPATQHLCASDNTCHANTDVAACGATCADCTVAPHPGGSTPICVPTTGTCSFDCPSGTIRSGLACVRVQLGDGSVAVGGAHTCAVTTADAAAGVPVGLWCWGANASGQLGVGTRSEAHKPQHVPLTLPVGVSPSSVVAGAAHTCSLATDGGVQCWGSNATAQLGADPAALVDSPSPRAVVLASARGLAAGTGHTCAIVNVGSGTGNVVCWGANDKGQLGGGTTSAFSATPVQVKTGPGAGALLSTVAQLSSSGDTTCAFTTGGVFCWGANDRGQAGQSTVTNPASVPFATLVPITAGAKIGAPVRVAAGGNHTCAATSLDTVCWGDDTVLQLGDAGRTGVALSSAPIDAAQLTNRADLVAAGRAHSCNVRSVAAGDLAPVITCAGANDKFQSGSGIASPSLNKGDVPLPAGGVTLLVSGGDHTCTVTAAGALLCFGSNTNGQLGDGTTTNTAAPISPAPQ